MDAKYRLRVLHRFLSEPKRTFKRYFMTIYIFLNYFKRTTFNMTLQLDDIDFKIFIAAHARCENTFYTDIAKQLFVSSG